MSLKSYLRQEVQSRIGGCEEAIRLAQNSLVSAQDSLDVLERTRTSRARYLVRLDSCWADHGEECTSTEHRGTLRDAIAKAEAEFKAANNRTDLQAGYSVEICLGEERYAVPEEYWDHLRERNR